MLNRRSVMVLIMFVLMYGMFYPQPGQAQQPAPPEAGQVAAPPATPAETGAPTIQVDKSALDNGGTILVTGKGPAGKPIFIEAWAGDEVRSSFFDSKPGKDGVIPYKLYMTEHMPAYYRIFIPTDKKEVLDKFQKQGRAWSYSDALKETGADVAYSVPAKIGIDAYQASFLASIIGSRGDKLTQIDQQENRRRSMQLVKARFRSINRTLVPSVDVKADGSYSAKVVVPQGVAPGKYTIVAVADKNLRSQPVVIENKVSFPTIYLSNAGTSLNALWPFLLTLAISIFGVLMGAGGGFILNPLLVSIWPLPHTIVAGTVMPTVLFSQASGIYNYSKIKFISWKLGVTMGLAMLVGGFIGPKLTELITLDQFKFVFGWVLLILAGLMFWQTTPGYINKNKKEQAILKEFKRRAEEAAKAKAAKV